MTGALAVAALLCAAANAGAPAIIEATSRGVWLGKPPLAEHSFDVELANPATAPRWLVLPRTFPYVAKDYPVPGGEEIELQTFVLSKEPRVVVVEGVGANFYAVRLPGGGTMTLRGLRIQSWWSAHPSAVELDVLVAREITVGGTPLAELLSVDPTSAAHADVEAGFDAGHPGALPFWHPPEGADGAPVTFDLESRGSVMVQLGADPRQATPESRQSE